MPGSVVFNVIYDHLTDGGYFITLTGAGGLGPLKSGSGNTYTIVYTPPNNIDNASAKIKIDAGGVQATADTNRKNIASNELTINYDTRSPTVILSTIDSDNRLNIADNPTTIEFDFSENVKGFVKSDITEGVGNSGSLANTCLLYTSPSPRDRTRSRMPSSA